MIGLFLLPLPSRSRITLQQLVSGRTRQEGADLLVPPLRRVAVQMGTKTLGV